MKRLSKYMLAGLAGLGICISALAVSPGSGKYCDQSGPGYGKGAGRMDNNFEQRMAQRKVRRAEREAALHAKLNLSADQESAWKEFIGSKPKVGPKRSFNRGEMANLSTPERMEKRQELMKERQARMAERVEEIKKFYSVLTPEQQKIFDDEFRPMKRGKRGFGQR